MLLSFLEGSGLVSSQAAREIAGHFIGRKLAKQDFLLREGKVCEAYFFLESGCMRSFAHNVDGQEITTGFFTSSQMVFEVSSFFQRTASRENIQCLSDCEGRMISYQELNSLFHALPEFREFGRLVLVKGFSALKSRMLSTITEPAEVRYDAMIRHHPEIFQYAALKHIATYLGITDTSLSRIRKAYARR